MQECDCTYIDVLAEEVLSLRKDVERRSDRLAKDVERRFDELASDIKEIRETLQKMNGRS